MHTVGSLACLKGHALFIVCKQAITVFLTLFYLLFRVFLILEKQAPNHLFFSSFTFYFLLIRKSILVRHQINVWGNKDIPFA